MERIIAKKAPCFSMEAVTGDGEEFINLDLETYSGKWLILFFYPMDFTFVCPTELTSFNKEFPRFHEAGAEILAVSTDSIYCHQTWIRSGLGHLNYPIAADKTMKVSSDYGVLLEDEGIALRGLFIIDPQQIVRYSVIHDNDIGRNTDEILRILKALQTNALCGANWSIGSETLKTDPVPKPQSQADPAENTLPLQSADRTEDASHPQLPDEVGTVRLYTLPDCAYCRQIKEYLKSKGLSYEEINLETDADGQAFMDDRGYTALPVTVIGSHEISGFRLDKIKEILESK